MVEALLDAGANRYASDDQGLTPLICASSEGHLAVLKTFMAAGSIDVDTLDSSGQSPFYAASQNGHKVVVLALLRAKVDMDKGEGTPLMVAVSEGHLPVLETLLAAGADLTIRQSDNGYTALHFAAQECRVDHVGALLRWGADETALTEDGKTPADLIDKSTLQHEAVRLLLARAPVDKAWRRRGWLVMLRSRTLKAGTVSGDGGDGGESEAPSVKQRGGSGGGKESLDLVEAVAKLGVDMDGVFPNVVDFL
eukprot:g9182.t1